MKKNRANGEESGNGAVDSEKKNNESISLLGNESSVEKIAALDDPSTGIMEDKSYAEIGNASESNESASLQSPSRMKNPFLLGLSACTAALQKSPCPISVLIICPTLCPSILIQHLPVLCHSASVPIVALGAGADSKELGAAFGLKNVLCLGVKV